MDCAGCQARLAVASFKSLCPRDADKEQRTRLATRLANVAAVTLDEMRVWM